MKAPYRLIVRNDETLEERASFRLSMMNVYVLMSTVIVLVAAILLCSLVNAHPEWLRYMYCTANEAQAIECTAKGWW